MIVHKLTTLIVQIIDIVSVLLRCKDFDRLPQLNVLRKQIPDLNEVDELRQYLAVLEMRVRNAQEVVLVHLGHRCIGLLPIFCLFDILQAFFVVFVSGEGLLLLGLVRACLAKLQILADAVRTHLNVIGGFDQFVDIEFFAVLTKLPDDVLLRLELLKEVLGQLQDGIDDTNQRFLSLDDEHERDVNRQVKRQDACAQSVEHLVKQYIEVEAELEALDQDCSLLLNRSIHIEVNERRNQMRVILRIPGDMPSQANIVMTLIRSILLLLRHDLVRALYQLLHHREHFPWRHEYQKDIHQMRAELHSLHIQIPHEVHQHEVKLGATERGQVLVVERFLCEVQLIGKVEELHPKRLLH